MNNLIAWRQPGKYDVDEASFDSAIDPVDFGESMTQQHLGPDTDVNVLARRYGLTGEMPVRRELVAYGEFDEAMDFQTLLANVKAGEAAFGAVPADVRAKFGNDAGAFLEWIHDDENYEEAEKLGLVPLRVVAPVEAPVAAAAPVPAAAAPAGAQV